MTAVSSRESVSETLKGQEQRDKERQREIIQGVLQAVYEELSAFQERYNKTIVPVWKQIEKDKSNGFFGIFLISPDCFIVYRSNANLVGQIENPPNLRRKIVKVYMELVGLSKSYEANNMFFEKYEEAKASGDKKTANELYSTLQTYGPLLKKDHENSMKLIEDILKILKKECNISDSVNNSI